MNYEYDAEVLVVGGGPVGLLAAMTLESHGATAIVLEQDPFLQPPNVKCNHVSSRTMEVFRRHGIADDVRSAGLPAEHPQDVAFRTSFVGQEFGRIRIPSAEERRNGGGSGPDVSWATPEHPHRVNQTYLEPILERHVASRAGIDLRNGVRVDAVSQDDSGVTAAVTDVVTGAQSTVRAKYLIGADGGRSLVRKAIGAKFSGDPVLQHVQSTWIRSTALAAAREAIPSWGTYVYNTRRNGHIYAINGVDEFLVHTYLTAEEAELGSVDRHQALRDILGVDVLFPYAVLSEEDWVARRLVADKFRDRRFFIAGDAAHLWVPMGGYGMNAGIADGVNLAWTIAAVLDGWAGEHMLDAYAAERQPITEQVSRFAMGHLQKLDAADMPANIELPGEEADLARARFGALAEQLNTQQFAAAGLNYGYSYHGSPIIVADGAAPEYTMGTYTPSTVPGCRMPHVWLRDGSSAYDGLGKWYTLVNAAGDADAGAAWAAAATAAGLPTAFLDLAELELPAAFSTEYLIVREDQHVAWRGDELPANITAFVQRLGARPDATQIARGAAPTAAQPRLAA
ncbi:FAD-dependent monooxygenase [Leucobacter sp. cx-42]|uniref:FAD-dependent monooxygenase n=1 Tax=unclassified Leucobacter TaxID=2621730 RepID=UPI00165D9080|nr:FAD-dependent monooxygenase [Leucobacter sp. cx-42]